MTTTPSSRISELLAERHQDLLEEWIREQLSETSSRRDLISEGELRQQSADFLHRLRRAVQSSTSLDIHESAFDEVRAMLGDLSQARAQRGFSPSETALFILSFKQPLFGALRSVLEGNATELADELWRASLILDRLSLFTTEVYQRSREEIILRQQQDLLELSTPVVKLWEGVVAVPLIGTLDSARAQVVMESLLEEIVKTGASLAIIDITGVPTVDTLVAQHLIKTVQAARLMGADCVISGIRPQIAQTMVHLGVVLGDVSTKATLADAIVLALRRTGYTVVRGGTASAT